MRKADTTGGVLPLIVLILSLVLLAGVCRPSGGLGTKAQTATTDR